MVPDPADPAAHLDTVLRVEALGPDEFLGRCPLQSFGRIYGGQLAAQALLAAMETVRPGFVPISVQTNFLKLGRIERSIRYEVSRVHDGRLLATRVVHAYQDDRLLSITVVSCQQEGSEHSRLDHDSASQPAPGPENFPARADDLEAHFPGRVTSTMAMSSWPFEVRYVDRSPWTPGPAAPANRLWMRSIVPLPADRRAQCVALTYAGDLHMTEPVLFPSDLPFYDLVNGVGVFGATLDYTMWFHRPFRLDDWLLHEQEAPAIANSRGLITGRFRSADGEIVASVSESVGIFTA